MKNENYSVVVNYEKSGKSFKSIVEAYIKNINKVKNEYWNFYNNDVKYK